MICTAIFTPHLVVGILSIGTIAFDGITEDALLAVYLRSDVFSYVFLIDLFPHVARMTT